MHAVCIYGTYEQAKSCTCKNQHVKMQVDLMVFIDMKLTTKHYYKWRKQVQ